MSFLIEAANCAAEHLNTLLQVLAAAPTPQPQPSGDIVDTSGVLGWLAKVIVPILLAVLGVIFIFRSRQGQVSQVVTSSGIAIVGLIFIGGAATLAFIGDDIVNLILQ